MSITVSETLNLAADLIEKEGWAHGCGWPGWRMNEGRPGLCLEGGIMAAVGLDLADLRTAHSEDVIGLVQSCPAASAVRQHLDLSGHLWGWNDSRSRTAAEVIEVLRATAVIEAAREQQTVEVA